jgi:pimeloyl-ACP methyl ester carboxylesterase
MARLGELEKERASLDAVEFCRKFWSVLGVLYVTDPKDAGRLDLDRCHLENERNAMKYWVEYLMPSMRVLDLTPNTVARVTMPVLTVHGRKDRSAPFGGGLDWVRLLPNARLLPVEGAGHMPWIETPALVLGSIERFLDGGWPDAAISRSRLEQDALGASSRRP